MLLEIQTLEQAANALSISLAQDRSQVYKKQSLHSQNLAHQQDWYAVHVHVVSNSYTYDGISKNRACDLEEEQLVRAFATLHVLLVVARVSTVIS